MLGRWTGKAFDRTGTRRNSPADFCRRDLRQGGGRNQMLDEIDSTASERQAQSPEEASGALTASPFIRRTKRAIERACAGTLLPPHSELPWTLPFHNLAVGESQRKTRGVSSCPGRGDLRTALQSSPFEEAGVDRSAAKGS
jgi:hypothetical protein